MKESTQIRPNRYQLKASQMMALYRKAEEKPDGLYYALIEAYEMGYKNGQKAEKLATKKRQLKRSGREI